MKNYDLFSHNKYEEMRWEMKDFISFLIVSERKNACTSNGTYQEAAWSTSTALVVK